MNLVIQSTTARTWKEVKAHHLLAGGLAILVAALLAAGGWRLAGSGGGTAAVQHVAPVAAPASTITSQPTATYYLVSSQDQADALQVVLDDATNIRTAAGDFRPFDQQITVAPDDETASQTVQFVAQLNDMLVPSGAQPIQVVDLRDTNR